MGFNIGSFGVVLNENHGNRTVPDFVWTKIFFDELKWDTGGRFGLRAGCLETGSAGRYHFAAGAQLLIPTPWWCSIHLMLYKNGEPLRSLTRETPLTRDDCSVAPGSREPPRVHLVRGFTTHGVVAEPGDVFEIYIRHECGSSVRLTSRCSEAGLTERQLAYFMGIGYW